MAWWSLLAAAIPYIVDYLQGDQYTGYEKEAMGKARKYSEEGFGKETIESMKRNISTMMGQETTARSTQLRQMLDRQRTPHAPGSAAMESLVSSMGGQRAQAMSNVDIESERAKMGGLQLFMQGATNFKPDSSLQELSGSMMGNELFNMLLQNMAGGGQKKKTDATGLETYKYGYVPQISNFVGNAKPYWSQYNKPRN